MYALNECLRRQKLHRMLEATLFSAEEGDRIVDPKSINLQREYDKFNRLIFQGELPKIPLKWTRSKKVGGTAGFLVPKATRYDSKTWKITGLTVSYFYEETYKEFLSDFIHEMIHIWEVHTGVANPNMQHAKAFMDKMKEINQRFPEIDITVKKNATHLKPSAAIKKKEYAVLTMKRKDGAHALVAVYNSAVFNDVVKQLTDTSRDYKDRYEFIEAMLVHTNFLEKFKVLQKFDSRLGMYPISAGVLKHLRQDATQTIVIHQAPMQQLAA